MSHHEHVLERPDAYVGATEPIVASRVVAEDAADGSLRLVRRGSRPSCRRSTRSSTRPA